MTKRLNFNQIKERLPFKYPFVLLDRAIIEEESVTAVKNVSMNEEFFQGHFPGNPIMPGVLQVETMTQAACLLLMHKMGDSRQVPVIKSVKKVKFRKPVLPGDRLEIQVEMIEFSERQISVKATTSVDGQVTCQGEIVVECLAHPDQAIRPEIFCPAIKKGLVPEEGGKDSLNITEIMDIIPHRYPFLLIDKILHTDKEELRTVGLKNITGNEPFFSGYLNNYSIVPNCLQMEMTAQVGCVYSLGLEENAGKIAFFMSIDEAIFHRPVLPGDQLVIDMSTAGSKGRFGKAEAKLYVGEELVTECTLKFAIVVPENN